LREPCAKRPVQLAATAIQCSLCGTARLSTAALLADCRSRKPPGPAAHPDRPLRMG
jgi:hypothetical protein